MRKIINRIIIAFATSILVFFTFSGCNKEADPIYQLVPRINRIDPDTVVTGSLIAIYGEFYGLFKDTTVEARIVFDGSFSEKIEYRDNDTIYFKIPVGDASILRWKHIQINSVYGDSNIDSVFVKM